MKFNTVFKNTDQVQYFITIGQRTQYSIYKLEPFYIQKEVQKIIKMMLSA